MWRALKMLQLLALDYTLHVNVLPIATPFLDIDVAF